MGEDLAEDVGLASEVDAKGECAEDAGFEGVEVRVFRLQNAPDEWSASKRSRTSKGIVVTGVLHAQDLTVFHPFTISFANSVTYAFSVIVSKFLIAPTPRYADVEMLIVAHALLPAPAPARSLASFLRWA